MQSKWVKKLLSYSIVSDGIKLSKKIILPGFDGLSIYHVSRFFFRGIQKGLIATKASSMAFKFFMALFPTVIFLLTLLPYIPIHDFRENLMNILEDVLPQSGYEFIEGTIVELVTKPSSGMLSFGFIFAIYLATNGIDGMLMAFKDSYNTSFKRGFIKQKATSVLLLFILTILVTIAIASIIVTEYVINQFFIPGGIATISIVVGKWIIIAFLVFFGISFAYYLGGNRKFKWRFFSAGSTFATFLVLLVSFGFGYYVDHFGNYNKVYGSIGTIIVLMLWIYFISFVLLIGFELNASIQQAGSIEKAEKKIEEEEFESIQLL